MQKGVKSHKGGRGGDGALAQGKAINGRQRASKNKFKKKKGVGQNMKKIATG